MSSTHKLEADAEEEQGWGAKRGEKQTANQHRQRTKPFEALASHKSPRHRGQKQNGQPPIRKGMKLRVGRERNNQDSNDGGRSIS